MKTLLLFPPPGDLSQPYVALPMLTAALRGAGHEVLQRDLNPELLRYLLRPEVYRGLLDRVWQRLRRGEASEGWNDPSRTLLLLDEDPARIEAAVATLKDPERYYEPELFAAARRSVRSLFRLFSAAHAPWEVDLFKVAPPIDPLLPLAELLPILDRPTESPLHDFYEREVLAGVADQGFGLVGISVTYGHQLVAALDLAGRLRRQLPGVPVVLGGAALTGYYPTFEAHPELFDRIAGVVLGDGEQAVVALAEALEQGRDWAQVPNLLWRDSAGALRRNARQEQDLAAQPCPDYGGLPLAEYLVPEVTLLVPVSRGCTWGRCGFCNFDALRCSYRERPPASVAADLVALQDRHGTRSFYLTGNTVRPTTLQKTAQALLDTGREFRWVVELRLDRGHKAAGFELLHRSGCRFVMFGLESASQAVQDRMNKGYKVEQFAPILAGAAAAGLRVGIEAFIGFPGETEDDARATARYLVEHKDEIAFFTLGTFVLDPHSIVARAPQQYGVAWRLPEGIGVADCFPRYLPFERTAPGALDEARVQALDAALYAELGEHFPYTLERFGQGIGGPDPTLYAIRYPTAFFHERPVAAEPPALRDGRDLAQRVPRWASAVVPRRLRGDPSEPAAPIEEPAPYLLVRESDGAFLALAPAAAGLLEAVDGARSVAAVLRASGLPAAAGVEVLLGLAEEGYLRLEQA